MIQEFDLLVVYRTPIDDLIDERYRHRIDLSTCGGGGGGVLKRHFHKPFANYVSLGLIESIGDEIAHDYIHNLVCDKETYGYLYHLANQRLLMPLSIQVNGGGDLVVDCASRDAVYKRIDSIVENFFDPGPRMFEITRLELLYFYTLIANPHLTWILVDHLLKGNQFHDYLVSAPARIRKVPYRKVKSCCFKTPPPPPCNKACASTKLARPCASC